MAEADTELKRISDALDKLISDIRDTNDVLYGNPRGRRQGLVEITNELSSKISKLQEDVAGLSTRMDIEAVQKKAVEENQAKMWSSVKSWGGLATAIMGIGQIINILINLRP